MRPQACFSRSGWWQTLCGLDAANQGFGWTSNTVEVGCADCSALVSRHAHEQRPGGAVLVPNGWRRSALDGAFAKGFEAARSGAPRKAPYRDTRKADGRITWSRAFRTAWCDGWDDFARRSVSVVLP